MVCHEMRRFQSSVFNFESTMNSKYLCLCRPCLLVLKEGLVWSISILLHLGYGSLAKMRAFFCWGQQHKLLVLLSMFIVLRKDISELRCLDGQGRGFALGLPDPLLSDVGRQEQVLWQHCLLWRGLQTGNAKHISARLSMYLWVPSCLWRYL